ncbi:hypothetical protein [Microbacterium sp. CJ88]|uniref:hypothetical protein n=1 Tax=Microbacterium sp. CJ88 TaxID=3445672 RepID=UPI003F65E62B
MTNYPALLTFLTAERLNSYLAATDGDLARAFELYEWNMRASASVMELTSMVEVLVRNALDSRLVSWAETKGVESWFDIAPLDSQGTADIRKARERATQYGRRQEVHGRVIAELSLGFWRYLVEGRYLTSLWVPSTHAAFPHGSTDIRRRQRDVKFRLQQLHFVRNRAAHHEPIHQRQLDKDIAAAFDLADWVGHEPGEWIRATGSLPSVLADRPI